MNDETEIIPASEMELVVPASAEKILEVFKKFEWMKQNLITAADRQKIADRSFIKKSGWMKIALACNLSLEKREERIEEKEGEIIFHYTYRAIAPSGRFADADASASSKERKFSHMPHDCRSLAQTRACNRCIANLVGGGEVSFEEVEGIPESILSPVSEEPIRTPSIVAALEQEGLDSDLIELSRTGDKFAARLKEYVERDLWDKYNQVLWKLGYQWSNVTKSWTKNR